MFFFSLLYFNLPLTIWLLASTDFFFCCKSLDLVHISRNNAFTPEVCCPRPTRCVCLISICRHATKTKERKHTVDVIWPFWNWWWDNLRPNVLAAGSGNWNSTPEVTTLKACVVSHTHIHMVQPILRHLIRGNQSNNSSGGEGEIVPFSFCYASCLAATSIWKNKCFHVISGSTGRIRNLWELKCWERHV